MNDYTTIPLSTSGRKHAGKYQATISLEDADLRQYQWTLRKKRYAYRNERIDGGIKSIHLHRVILARKLERDELLPTEFVDHIDGDTFNNTRPNLRLATSAQNGQNRGKQPNNTSGYKGVTWHKATQKWLAKIRVNGKTIHLGVFNDIELANKACIAAREKYHGEFAKHE